jgi:hypothetical protein
MVEGVFPISMSILHVNRFYIFAVFVLTIPHGAGIANGLLLALVLGYSHIQLTLCLFANQHCAYGESVALIQLCFRSSFIQYMCVHVHMCVCTCVYVCVCVCKHL